MEPPPSAGLLVPETHAKTTAPQQVVQISLILSIIKRYDYYFK